MNPVATTLIITSNVNNIVDTLSKMPNTFVKFPAGSFNGLSKARAILEIPIRIIIKISNLFESFILVQNYLSLFSFGKQPSDLLGLSESSICSLGSALFY